MEVEIRAPDPYFARDLGRIRITPPCMGIREHVIRDRFTYGPVFGHYAQLALQTTLENWSEREDLSLRPPAPHAVQAAFARDRRESLRQPEMA